MNEEFTATYYSQELPSTNNCTKGNYSNIDSSFKFSDTTSLMINEDYFASSEGNSETGREAHL